MKLKSLLILFLLISIQAISQDKNWSFEANYAIVPSSGFGGRDNVIDVGLKSRFVDFKYIKLGFSFNAGFSTEKSITSLYTGRTNIYYFQPRIFIEVAIPQINNLRPTVGLGYSIIESRFNYKVTELAVNPIDILNPYFTDRGFNFNFGLTYDINKRFFVQAQYDFIKLKKNSNNIRIGVGFRF